MSRQAQTLRTLVRVLGLRRCYRRAETFHGVSNIRCDCLRVELPMEAQAKSSGRLATPERNRRCPDCSGLGRVTREGCPRCLGTGELTAAGTPPAIPDSSDRVTRKRLSAARSSGLVGAGAGRGGK